MIKINDPRKTKSKRKKSKKKINKKTKKNNIIPKVGNKVEIGIKPYKGKKSVGIVDRVLTKKKYHSRGHKVLLKNGKIGRILKIF